MTLSEYEFGQVLLLNAFPYSQPGQVKKRPVLVLADIGDQDIVVARITSEGPRNKYDLLLDRWKESGLLLPSSIRLTKIATLQKTLVLKKLGRLGSPERRKVRTILKNLFNL
jgi:mRNA-degrading endonuclease toxin of MazEF toxin-antitoxin module